MKIAVTGATGFVGSHLAEGLVARGHEVTVLARGPERLLWIRQLPVRVVYGDLERVDALREFVGGQEVIVHVAGLTRACSREEFLRVNVGGTVRLLEAALAHDPALRRFVYLSSQAALGPSPDGTPVAEDAVPRPISLYGESKSAAERELASFAERVGITVVRPPWVFGPRDRDTLSYFRITARGLRLVTRQRNRYSIVFIRNLALGLALAAESPLAGLRAYSFADDGDWTLDQLTEMMAEAMGRRTLKVPVPLVAVAVAAAAAELGSAITGRPALMGWQKLGEARNPYWLISDRRAREDLGYRPLVGTEQGMRETAAWYRAQRWL